MQTRRLGTSGLEISRVGLGTWAIGGAWEWGWGHQDDGESIRTIHRALEHGVDWIDTAPVYGLGRAEEVVARALAQSRYRPSLFTKCGIAWDARGRTSHDLSAASVARQAEDSLRRLGVEVIDLYQIHWPVPDAAVEEAWGALAGLVEAGKVRHIGVSNFSVEQLERARAIAEVTSLQPPYSLLRREAEDELLPYCRRHGIGVIGYSPLASGLLTGKMTRERVRTLPDGDWRKTNKGFREPALSRGLKLVDRLAKIAEQRGCSVAAVAVAWALANPAVDAAIVGMRHPDQVDGALGAAALALTPEETAVLDRVY